MLINIVESSQPNECTTIARVHILSATVVHDSDSKTRIMITEDVTADRGTCSMAIEPRGMVLLVRISCKSNNMLEE